jgi:membrane peptidoglycan carboxypeptidase
MPLASSGGGVPRDGIAFRRCDDQREGHMEGHMSEAAQKVLASMGEINRTEVPYDNIVDGISQAAVAAEDPDFWTDSGGLIARSVARTALEIVGDGLSTRARAVIVARKLDNVWSKEQLLGTYLNDSAFGRLSYGADAAARAYFGKGVLR